MKLKINRIVVSKVKSSSSYLYGDALEKPRDWNDVVHFVAEKLTNKSLHVQSIKYFLSNRNLAIFWSPALFVYFAALLKRRFMYLCWGMPKPSHAIVNKLKYHKLKCILKKSAIVLVNEQKTYHDIYKLTNIKAIMAPYVVDTDYYKLSRQNRENYIIAPGDNDRNEELIRSIATNGFKVFRIARSQSIIDYHKSSRNVIVKYKISFSELRFLYQKASSIILPITSSNHAAGQTAALEALACGTPVIISAGRTADIFSKYESVQICKSNDYHEWVSRIHHSEEIVKECALIEKVRNDIVRTNSFDTVCRFYLQTIHTCFDLL